MSAGAPLVADTSPMSYGGDADVSAMMATGRHPNLLLAVINPMSGERSASAAVHDAFCAALGLGRVFKLDGDTFKDPSKLRGALQRRAAEHEAAFQRHQSSGTGVAAPLVSGMRRKPSVLVAGGDGTVAFVMDVVQEAFSQEVVADKAKASDDRIDRAAQSTSLRDGLTLEDVDELLGIQDEPSERIPAVGVFPMGTGNDLSFTLGFGLGFTTNHCCAACVCCPRDVDGLLDATLSSPVIRFDRWEATISRVGANAAGGAILKRVGFNNYVSFGMDADIARRFDESRRAYPSLHRFRTMNKLWYGVHGLTATPFAHKFGNRNVTISTDGTATPLPSSANNCKAIVVTNVLGYSGGVDLWKLKKPEIVTMPRQAERGSGFENRRVPLLPGSVGDGRVEVQTVGGLFHMTVLRSGIIGADRVAQGSTVDIVVSDPDGSQHGVILQADGEPLGQFTVPFRIQVRPAPRGPLFVHSAPQSIATARSATSVMY